MEVKEISSFNAPQLVIQNTIEPDYDSDKFIDQFPKQIAIFENITPIIIDKKEVNRLCTQQYYKHPKGCPNWNKKKGCPPNLPLINQQYNLDTIHAIILRFPFLQYIEQKRIIHPDWTTRALINQRHWEAHLRSMVYRFWDINKENLSSQKIIKNPEGQGVNIEETLKQVGVQLEWCKQDKNYNIIEIPDYMHYVCLTGEELE